MLNIKKLSFIVLLSATTAINSLFGGIFSDAQKEINENMDKYAAVYCYDPVKMLRNLYTKPSSYTGMAYDIATRYSAYKHIVIDVTPQNSELAEPWGTYANGYFLGYATPGAQLQLNLLNEDAYESAAFGDPIPLKEGKYTRKFSYNHVFPDESNNYSQRSKQRKLEYDVVVIVKKVKERVWTSFAKWRNDQDVYRVEVEVNSRQFGRRGWFEWY